MAEVDKRKHSSVTDLVKNYLESEIDYGKLTVTEKLAEFATAAALFFVLALLAMVAVFFIAATCVYLLSDLFGNNTTLALLVVSVVLLLIALFVWLNRKEWIFNPISRYVSKLLISPIKKKKSNEK